MAGVGPLHLHAKVSVPFAKATPQHLRYQDIRHLFAPGYFDHIFTVVRNPYARLEREYRMRSLIAEGRGMGGMPSFSTWLETALGHARANPWHLDNHMRP